MCHTRTPCATTSSSLAIPRIFVNELQSSSEKSMINHPTETITQRKRVRCFGTLALSNFKHQHKNTCKVFSKVLTPHCALVNQSLQTEDLEQHVQVMVDRKQTNALHGGVGQSQCGNPPAPTVPSRTRTSFEFCSVRDLEQNRKSCIAQFVVSCRPCVLALFQRFFFL